MQAHYSRPLLGRLSFPFLLAINVLLLAGSLSTSAFDTSAAISGSVFDPQRRAIQGAEVVLFSASSRVAATVTDSSGSFQFGHIAPGQYWVEVHAPGFAISRVEKIRLTSHAHPDIQISLTVRQLQQQVSVTASATPQPVDQLSKALSIVDNSSIDQRQDYSLADAVRFTPGLRIAQGGGPGALTEFYIRGLRPQDTAVLVDGLRLRDASANQGDASALLEDFMVTDVDRIEILRGSGSSLYGTNAIGGVVNVITDPGGGKMHGSVLAEGGSLGLFRGRALLAGGVRNDRLQYTAGLTQLNVVNGVQGNQPARISSAQARLSYHLNSTTQLTARFLGSDSTSRLSTGPQALIEYPVGILPAIPATRSNVTNATYIPSIADPDYNRKGRFETGALALQSQPTPKLGYHIDYQIVDSSRTYGNGPAGAGFQSLGNTISAYGGRINTVSAQGNYQPASSNLLTAGYEFENESFSNRNSVLFAPGVESSVQVAQRSNTAFVQDQAKFFNDRLYFSLAGRYQSFLLDRPVFNPSQTAPFSGSLDLSPPAAYTGDASLAYTVKRSQTKFRAHVGRGYRAPSLYERFGAGYDPLFGYSVYGDPTLKPEQSIAFDTGIDQLLYRNRLRISATYFYTRLQRTIIFALSGILDPATDPFGRFVGYLNTGGRLARGAELSSEWAVNSRLTVSTTYTYTDSRERTPLVPGVYRSFVTPQHQFTAFAVQRIGTRIFFDLGVNAASNYLSQVFSDFSSGAFRFPGMKRVDLGGSYRLPLSDTKAVRFFGKAENLADQSYFESGFRTPGITARGGLQFEF